MHSGDYLSPDTTLLEIVKKYKWNEDAPVKFLYTFTIQPVARCPAKISKAIQLSSPARKKSPHSKKHSYSPVNNIVVKKSSHKVVAPITLKIEKCRNVVCSSRSGKRKHEDRDTWSVVSGSCVHDEKSEQPTIKKVKREKKIHNELNTDTKVNSILKGDIAVVKKEANHAKQFYNDSNNSEECSPKTVVIKKEKQEEIVRERADQYLHDYDNGDTSSLNSSRDDGDPPMVIDESQNSDEEMIKTPQSQIDVNGDVAGLPLVVGREFHNNVAQAMQGSTIDESMLTGASNGVDQRPVKNLSESSLENGDDKFSSSTKRKLAPESSQIKSQEPKKLTKVVDSLLSKSFSKNCDQVNNSNSILLSTPKEPIQVNNSNPILLSIPKEHISRSSSFKSDTLSPTTLVSNGLQRSPVTSVQIPPIKVENCNMSMNRFNGLPIGSPPPLIRLGGAPISKALKVEPVKPTDKLPENLASFAARAPNITVTTVPNPAAEEIQKQKEKLLMLQQQRLFLLKLQAQEEEKKKQKQQLDNIRNRESNLLQKQVLQKMHEEERKKLFKHLINQDDGNKDLGNSVEKEDQQRFLQQLCIQEQMTKLKALKEQEEHNRALQKKLLMQNATARNLGNNMQSLTSASTHLSPLSQHQFSSFPQRPPAFINPTKPRLGRPPNPNKVQRPPRGRGGGRGGRGRRDGGTVAASPRPTLPQDVSGVLQQQGLLQAEAAKLLPTELQQQLLQSPHALAATLAAGNRGDSKQAGLNSYMDHVRGLLLSQTIMQQQQQQQQQQHNKTGVAVPTQQQQLHEVTFGGTAVGNIKKTIAVSSPSLGQYSFCASPNRTYPNAGPPPLIKTLPSTSSVSNTFAFPALSKALASPLVSKPTSASSAAYFVASSRFTSEKFNCFFPEPTNSLYDIVLVLTNSCMESFDLLIR